MPHPIVPVETERLTLRRFVPEDFEAFHGYHRLPEVARFLYRNPRTPEQSRSALERFGTMKFEGEGDEIVLAVEARETRALLGDVVLKWVSREARQAEPERLSSFEHDIGALLLGDPDATFVGEEDASRGVADGECPATRDVDLHEARSSSDSATGMTGQAHSTPSATSP